MEKEPHVILPAIEPEAVDPEPMLAKLEEVLDYYVLATIEELKRYRKMLGTEASQRQIYMLGSEFLELSLQLDAFLAKVKAQVRAQL
jgi:hypothetical protein